MTGNLKTISDSRIRYIVSKGPKYRFPSRIDSKKCREEIASALNDFGNRWCKREYVEPDALKEWKVSIFKIVDQRIKFYSQNTNLLPPKPKSTFRHLKQGIQDFHRKCVLVPADKAANNVKVQTWKTEMEKKGLRVNMWFLTVTCSCCPYLYFGSAIMLERHIL